MDIFSHILVEILMFVWKDENKAKKRPIFKNIISSVAQAPTVGFQEQDAMSSTNFRIV